MATRPPAPPPRGPLITPPAGRSTLRTVLLVIAWTVGGFVALVVVGTGLIFPTCAAAS